MGPMAFPYVGRGKYQKCLEPLDIDPEVMLIPRELKQHCGSPVKVGDYGDQMINENFTKVWIIVSTLVPVTSAGHFHSSRMHKEYKYNYYLSESP